MKTSTRRLFLLMILFSALTLTAIVLFTLAPVPSVEAQSCDNIPQGGGESINADITAADSGQALSGSGVVPSSTWIEINALATAFGECIGMAWHCQVSPCVCQETGAVYQRTVNHIGVYVDISSTGLNGTYFVGNVYGKNPNGTTAMLQVLDTRAANSSGPLSFLLSYPGTYTFRIKSIINTTPCNIQPGETNEISITINVAAKDKAPNRGKTSCEENVGDPVNVTNGNMYLTQTDYRLPGIGQPLEITRTYNSSQQTSGLFGVGWSSILDESVVPYGNLLLRLSMPDGRGVYFKRDSVGDPFDPIPIFGFHGQIVKNVDNSYTLTFRDGSVHQFNANGKLTSFADPNGNTITLTLNGSGNPTTITDASGRTVTLTYDSQSKIATISDSLGTIATYARLSFGRMSSVTYADGSKYQFTYVITGNNIYLTTVKDALNNVLESHTYDAQGRAITSERAGGTNRYTLSYVSATETDVTDALNRVTKYFYDSSTGRNVVTRVEGSCGCGNSQVSEWTYDADLNLVSETDGLNHTTTYTYDADGNQLTQTDATGTITFTYNSLGQVLTKTDQMNGVWTNTYDAHGNRLTAKDPLNNTTTFTYNSQGQLLTVTDPRNNTTTLLYDTNGSVMRRTDALNNQTNATYDARSRTTSVTNALNQVTSYEYDLAGRLKKIIYPDTNFVLYTFDLAGRKTKVKDPRGYETTLAYDAAHRLTSETNANNKTTTYAYDLMSNLTGVTDALNRTTNYFYDDFNRLTKVKYPEATAGAGRLEENFTYDSAGNLLTRSDQAGSVTSFCYDSADRLTSMIDPAQKTTTYEYNARSQRTAVVDAINQRYEFVYDALNRVTQEKKGTATRSLVYDAAGNRSQRTDYNGAITNYTYNALNRLTTTTYPDTTTATYGYDAISRLTTATNPTGTVTIGYDNRGRTSSVTDVFGQVVAYQYDANSNRTQLSLNASTIATYQHDVIDRLTQLTDNATLNTSFTYDATDKIISRTLPNGVVSTWDYDGLDRLTRLKHVKGANTLADFQYQLSAASNFTQMIDGAGTHTYTYDTRDRLTAATHPNQPNESYGLDDVGNRVNSHLGSSYTYDPFNRLVTANSSSFSYDTVGNLISKQDAGGNWTYTWDYEDRLTQATLSGGATVTYSYDALGRRVARNSSVSGTTRFVYDGADVVRDLDGAGNVIGDYLNGPGVDSKLRQIAGGATAYLVSDHLGSTRGLTDANGAMTSTVAYDSYGNVVAGSLPTRYTFTGRESDPDTGLMYYRARWYDPRQGRFISEDPIGFGGGINFYNYVGSNPVRFIDPFGLCQEDNIGPCEWEEQRDMKEAANAFKGDFNAPPHDWKFTRPPGTTDDQIIDALKNNGFEEFWNPFHWGTDLQKNINGRWYHFTVNDGEISEHYEISKPNSLAHKLNFTEPWKRPSEEECERRKMGSVPSGGQIPETKPKPKPKPKPRPRPRPKPPNNGRKPCCL